MGPSTYDAPDFRAQLVGDHAGDLFSVTLGHAVLFIRSLL